MKTLTQIALAYFLLSLIPGIRAQGLGPMLLESPTVSRTHVAFSFAGDIWLVDRQGGDARRLTIHPGRETYPVLSPDGSQAAFTRLNAAGGPFGWDVFTVPVTGGDERRPGIHQS